MCLRLSALYFNYLYAVCGAACFQHVRIFVLYLIIIMKPDIWIISHCRVICHEIMFCVPEMHAQPQHYPYLRTFYKTYGLFKQLELIPGIGEETWFLTDRNHRNVVYKLDLINVTSGLGFLEGVALTTLTLQRNVSIWAQNVVNASHRYQELIDLFLFLLIIEIVLYKKNYTCSTWSWYLI